jgi:protein-S-isoprenylcysteine O-methyltransferase Ste14
VQAPPWHLALCVSLWGFGVFLHFASDMQKHMWLKLRPGELLTEGLWARVRNPNYLGELLIYLAFALLAMHWLPLLLLLAFILVYWLPNMRRKDRSLARYGEFEAYRQRSKLLLPWVW